MNIIRSCFCTLLASLITLAASSSNAAAAIPEGALGMVSIPSVTKGSLPFLHGMKGEGRYITFNNKGQRCQVSPLPFIAGGFDGNQIGISSSPNIELAIYSQALSDQLKAGKQITSDEFDVTLEGMSYHGDISIVSGLSLEEGFIINPRKAWSSWFGTEPKPFECEVLAE